MLVSEEVLEDVLVDGVVVGVGVWVAVGWTILRATNVGAGVEVGFWVGVGINFFPKTELVFFGASWVFLSPLIFAKIRETRKRTKTAKNKTLLFLGYDFKLFNKVRSMLIYANVNSPNECE